jgi:RluA family pseudouridine synthase
MKQVDLTVGAAQGGMRLDVYLAGAGLGLSRRRIRQVIDVGGVYINRKRIRIASRQVMRGDKVRVEYSETTLKSLKGERPAFRPEDLLLDGAEDGILAVNKPPGMPSQATKDQAVMHVVPCLEALLKELEGGKPCKRQLILVHRLDKETSGVLLVADGPARATWLTERFRAREVKKRYSAICYGIPAWSELTERAALSEIDKKTGAVRTVRSGGRSAVTHFRVLATDPGLGVSLIECRPETGRSHQIRVHLAVNGLPIVGDKRYGGAPVDRRPLPPSLAELTTMHHFLHAERLEFIPGPSLPPRVVVAAPPERFTRFLAASSLNPAGRAEERPMTLKGG